VDVQWLAAKSLGKIGDLRAVEPLIEALGSNDNWLRSGAAWGLGKLRDTRAVPAPISPIKDKKTIVQKNAPWALETIGDERVLPPIREAAVDPDENVRDTIQRAIASIENKRTKKSSPIPSTIGN